MKAKAYIVHQAMCEPKLEWSKPKDCLSAEPLYTTPPQRTWVGLTDKDWNRSRHNQDFQKGVDWAEAMLKGKNT